MIRVGIAMIRGHFQGRFDFFACIRRSHRPKQMPKGAEDRQEGIEHRMGLISRVF
jgi:hypothetical protein